MQLTIKKHRMNKRNQNRLLLINNRLARNKNHLITNSHNLKYRITI